MCYPYFQSGKVSYHDITSPSTVLVSARWSMTLQSKLNLPYKVNCRRGMAARSLTGRPAFVVRVKHSEFKVQDSISKHI